jgi:imidazolonepropionase-like amidohydrolase
LAKSLQTRAREAAEFSKDLALVKAMRDAGVELLAGTDSPNCLPGFCLHDELLLLVQAGLTPMEALQTATRNAARYFDREQDWGTVEVGKLADLVLLDADPLNDIRNTQKIRAVVIAGRLLNRSELDAMLDKVKRHAQ